MKMTTGEVRGNNRVSKLLNKPIKGKLAEKKTPLPFLLIISAAFIVILIFSVRELGVKDGVIITSAIAFFGVIAYIQAKHRVKESEKHKWKAFEDEK